MNVKKRTPRAIPLILGVIFAMGGVPAETQQLNIQSYGTAEGLPQQQVVALHQDATGYLWLATLGGASRYDGQRFRTFNLADGLRTNVVLDITEDSAGRLWAATEGGGLCRFDGERFHCRGTEAGLPSNDVYALAADRKGGLWAATAAGLIHMGKDGRRVFTSADGLPSDHCLAVVEEAAGSVWVGTDAGLARLAGSRFEPVAPEILGRRQVILLYPAPQGLVVGTDAGAYLFKDGALRRLALPSPLDDAKVSGAALAADGSLWLTTREGAARLHDRCSTVVSTANGLPTDALFSILVDREGNIWTGTYDGLSKLVFGPFRSYTEADGLAKKYVAGIAADARGRLWLAMPTGGIALLDRGSLRSIANNEDVTGLRVYSLASLPDGRMLAGTVNGLAVFEDERLVQRIREIGPGVPLSDVDVILGDAHGAWLGTQEGLARFQDGKVFPVAKPGLQGRINSLAYDDEGRLWVGLYAGGVAIYDGRSVERLNAANGLTNQSVPDLALLPDGSMLVASSGEGFFLVKEGNIRQYTMRDGLVDNTIWSALCDRLGDVWLYTNRGLDRFNGRSFRHYGHSDGLVALEGSTHADMEDAAGNLWFGTGKGLVRFTPREERINTVPPQVVVEGHATRLGSLRSGMHLRPGMDLLTFRFASLSYRNPTALRYRYRIAGLEEHWTGPTAETSVSIASPPPGSYVFEVTGSNEAGLYAPAPARFAFVVDPFFWQTWWFRLSLVAALAAVLLALHRWRTRRLETERRRLEQAVAERTAEIAAVNERLAKLATTDELTALPNRRQFHQTLESHLGTLSRMVPAQSLSVLLLDVDRFKQVNDVYGHPAGDCLLAFLAERLRTQVRSSDLVARYGGEEFAVILPATDRAGAARIAAKLHAAVRQTSFEIAGQRLRITVSIGVTTTRVTGPDILGVAERLVEEADEALYRAKRDGRDRIVAAGPTLVAPAVAAAG